MLDSKNHLWVATLDGLLCIDLSVKRVKALIRRNQGLLNNSLERQLCIINNILVVPDWSKYCFLNLNEFRFNTTKPKLILSNIKIGELRYPFLNTTEFYGPITMDLLA
ncbi:MAG: hypothetical protein IPK62_16080 [Bacteroidetes bacterium]|nr:hypothetical protein [Bacteroidota bacterium]